MQKPTNLIWRVGLVGLIAVALSLVMVAALLRTELKASASGESEAVASVGTSTKLIYTAAARGEIFDRYGRPLVANVYTYRLQFEYALWTKAAANETAAAALALLDKYGLVYQDSLPLAADAPELTSQDDARFSKFVTARGWSADAADGEALFSRLRSRYGIDEELGYAEARRLIGLRYDVEQSDFSAASPFILAEDIGQTMAAELADLRAQTPALCAASVCTREYCTSYAAHLLGRTGKISAAEYAELSDSGYKLSDTLGKDGAEKAFESYLRGEEGYQKLRLDDNGRVAEIISESEPVAGSNVYLTIDLKLQEATEKALSAYIQQMVAEGEEDETKPQDVAGGAAVVIDIATADVLAMASYPSFDISRFSELYNELAADELTPMLNRALSGIYSPGSTFKMVTAVAGLEEGVITPESVITDTGIYTYYKDYQPSCWIYNRTTRITHGDETVIDAIRDSCNVFFYDVGRRLGIETLSSYAYSFGLGNYTGIELSGESKGYVASPSAKKSLAGASWVDGDTLQAAIGQSYNLFTPLQLTNYIATLANGGTRREVHLLKYVCSGDYSSVELAMQSVISGRLNISTETYEAVMKGMNEVTENGTASSTFQNYEVHVGGKTGSAQVSSGTANSVFCAFAPFDDPQIAVVVIVEHGGSGNRIAPIAKAVFEAYFALDKSLS